MNVIIKLAVPLLAALYATAPLAADATRVSSYPASTLEWIEIPKSGGIKYASVKGDLAGQGSYAAFVNFPGGKDNSFHYHSSAIPTVVLKGTFYAVIDGVRTEYPAGSFYDLPAKLEHFSGCAKGPDCTLLQYQDGPFDLVPRRTSNRQQARTGSAWREPLIIAYGNIVRRVTDTESSAGWERYARSDAGSHL